MAREKVKATVWGVLATALLAGLIVLGSRDLAHFDAALVGYTFATLFATFGIAYRYAMWLQRPPTALYWRRGWRLFLRPRFPGRDLWQFGRRLVAAFALNRFIWRRSPLRGAAHWLIMWGCVLAAAITFPLVFGWIHFETLPGDLGMYRASAFGFPTPAFRIESAFGFLIFHALVWASLLVIAGVIPEAPVRHGATQRATALGVYDNRHSTGRPSKLPDPTLGCIRRREGPPTSTCYRSMPWNSRQKSAISCILGAELGISPVPFRESYRSA